MDEEKYWFKAKTYGYGWTPSTWQGWVVILAYLVVLALIYLNTASQHLSDEDSALTFVPQVLVATTILIVVAWKKGEPARWRWGK